MASIAVRVGEHAVTLLYSVDGEARQPVISLAWTRCHFGGEQAWFLCPRCYRRSVKLYLRWGVFRCRRCQRMGYVVENQDLGQRLWIKGEKIERRLGPDLARPKRMRERTYERLLERYYDAHERRDDWFDQELLRHWGHWLPLD